MGLPPALNANFHGPYWGNKFDTENTTNITTQKAIGQPFAAGQTYGATCDNNNLANLVGCPKDKLNQLSARQAFAKLKPEQGAPHMPMPYRCTLAPPEQINAFSDGSWKHPRVFYFSLGGAGVWWPNRSHRLSDPEHELAMCEKTEQVWRLYTAIGGFAGSSTRTELAAAILAISSHGPVHLGSDSKAFVTRANFILALLAINKFPKERWKLIADGDLWEHFYLAA
jgi:hypothetical protein